LQDVRTSTPMLDLRSRLVPLGAYDERGLLGLAVHPNFAQNPLIYTYTSEPSNGPADFSTTLSAGATNNHQSVIAEWRLTAGNTNEVDPASRREILRIDQPQSNHNGGAMHFGPDGLLYVALGDGGQADDQGEGHSPMGNGQDTSNPFGSMLRIDVDARTSANSQYGVPTDNPFVGADGVDEIYAYGFRNPYRFSFDRMSGQLYVADVGQNSIEEIDVVTKGGNYGWRVKEGTFFFDPNGASAGYVTDVPVVPVPAGLIDPIAQYDHDEGLAVVGGYVYRGSGVPALQGRYVCSTLMPPMR
jgi:glucose/arabinose dehydrogenase